MPRQQGNFGTGVGIVEPDAERTGHRQPRAIGRIGHRSVTLSDGSFAQAGEGPFRQIPASMVLGAAGLHEQDSNQQQGDVE